VPFELGRPFGAPDEPAFQTKILRTVLALFERDDGPVILEDFDEDPPGGHSYDQSGWTCPVSFPKPKTETKPALHQSVLDEIGQLAPWSNLALEERGRTAFGVSQLDIAEAAAFVASFLDGLPENPRDDIALGETLRFACEDIKMWYQEAATSKPGVTNSRAVADWFWGDTAAGVLFLAVYPICLRSADAGVRRVADSQFIPRAQEHRLT
jgi:hypothetical protein